MKNLIRLKNLQHLAYEYCSRSAVAERLGMESTELERYFKNEHLSVSDSFARNIEEKLEKPAGWMDRINYDIKITTEESELLNIFRSSNRKDKNIILAVAEAINKN